MIEAERANLAAIVEHSPAFICILRGPEHVLELANEEYFRLVGRRLALGRRIRDLLPEVEGQGFFEMLDRVYSTGETTGGTEVPVIVGPESAPDRKRFVNFVYQALRGPDGKPNAIFVHGVDITETVLAREAIAAGERRWRLAMDAAGVGSYNIGPTGVMDTDARFRAIFGYTGSGDLGYEAAVALIHPDDRQNVLDEVGAAIRVVDPKPYAADYRVVHADGSIHWVAARGGATFDKTEAGSKLVSFDGTVTDITDRKQAEDELEFQRHQLELIFREAPAAMALWRGEELIFERVNPLYQAWFGERQLVGKSILEAVPELRGQGFDEMLLKVLRTGEPYTGHEALARFARSAEGPVEDRYFDFTYLQVRDVNGKPYGVFDHAVEVTERVRARQALETSEQQLQEALRERQSLLDAERAARGEAEQAGRMKDEFLATLSHELRTPLNAIVGWTHLLRDLPDPTGELREGLGVISRNAKAQTQIIEDILDMSRIVSGKLRLDMSAVDLAQCVKAGAATMQPAAEAKGVTLHVTDDAVPCVVRGDVNRLQQVFWNLIANAVKFTPRGGRVEVTVRRKGEDVEVQIADTGEGIDPAFVPHVFDRFRQADSSTTRRHGGLGLGLSIVKQIVELHGGIPSVRSPGKGLGATFVVTLPAAEVFATAVPVLHPIAFHTPLEEEPPELDETCSDRLDGITVVAVDDEPDAAEVVYRLLSGCGARVRVAHSAAEALELIAAEPPAVLVSDIGMPGEDGFMLIRKVRALAPDKGGRLAALALTAYTRSVDRIRVLEAGFQMHIAKPIDPAELVVSVAALTRQS